MSAPRRRPNFSALRAFEAAARHGNFSRAADELHLTHGAVSHQVRALERELGRALFIRKGRQVTVTSEALKFAQALARSFDEIAAAADAMRADTVAQRLTVSAIPSFAARWLAPRLGGFIDLYPAIEVVLQSSGQLQDLAREGIDVGIRFGRGNYPGMLVERLARCRPRHRSWRNTRCCVRWSPGHPGCRQPAWRCPNPRVGCCSRICRC